MKLAKVVASTELLYQMMFKGWSTQFTECVRGLPEGTEFVYSYGDDERGLMYFVVSHPSFPEGALGTGIPELPPPQFRKLYSPEAEVELEKLKADLSQKSPTAS